jgi:hypothetical protein
VISRRRLAYALAALLGSSPVAGCVATSSPPPSRGVVVSGPPPPAVAEARTAPPGPNAVWLDGYWHWTGAQYAWIPGHWEQPPPGAAWYGPRYVSSEGSHFYEPGGWRSPGGAGGPGAPSPPAAQPQVPPNRSAFH